MTGKTPFFALRRMLCTLLSILCVAGIAAPVAAQEEDAGWEIDPFARVELGVVISESADRDDELIIVSDGGYARGQVGVRLRDDNTTVRLEADRIQVERFGNATGRPRYDRDRFTGYIEQEVAEGWSLRLRGRYTDDISGVESSDIDELNVAVRVEYEPSRDHRIRAEASWRDREYADDDGVDGAPSTGEGPRADVGYRHRLGRYHYINVDLRAEEITSDNDRRNYTRESAKVAYTHPITSDFRVRPALQWRHTTFQGRIAPDDTAREDTTFVPELEFHWWPGPWRLEAEAKYVITSSNEPVRDRDGYRFTFSLGYVF